MTDRRWERITAGAGLAAVLLCLAGLMGWVNPQYDDPLSSVTNSYVHHAHQVYRSQFFFLLFGIALLTWTAGLRAILERGVGETHVLPTFAFGAGVINAVWMMIWATVNGGLALVAGQLTGSDIRLAIGIESVVDFFTGLSFGLVALTAALAMFETRTFSRWIRWLGAVSGALCITGDVGLIDPTGPLGNAGFVGFVGQILFLAWLIIVGVSLLRRSPVAMHIQEAPMHAEHVAV